MRKSRISQLSDDILISIISRLTIREAIATSILSCRWRYLHTYVTHLDFPPFNFSGTIRFPSYMNTVVHRVLDSHKGGRVKVLKVDTNRASLDKLLEFALTKEAEIIDIRNCGTTDGCFLRLASNLNIIRLLPAGLKDLTQLSLSDVLVNDQDFEVLISNSPALETLSIEPCYKLENVKIIGHPKLKHLDLSYVWSLESIDIRDVINLVSLKLYELRSGCDLQLSNIPNFIKLGCREFRGDLPNKLFARMPSCIRDQLQLFNLSTNPLPLRDYDMPIIPFPNIKYLKLVLDMRNYFFVYLVHPLIEACPSLEKLKIKFKWKEYPSDKMSDLKKGEASEIYRELAPRKGRELAAKLSRNLKEVEMIGYSGSQSELKLASYIINNAASLQELIVVTDFDLKEEKYRIEFDCARRDFHRIITSSEINFFLF